MSALAALLAALPDDDFAAVDRAVEGFAAGWADPCPPLAAHVAAVAPHLRAAAAAHMVELDLHRRAALARSLPGVRLDVADHLRAFPELAADAAVAVELIRAEYDARPADDPAADAEDFARRFPAHADALRRVLAPRRRPGPRFERFALLGGGMGVVHRAWQPTPGRWVALKFLPGGAADPDAAERFRREAEVLAGIKHPNVLPVLEVGGGEALGLPAADGRPFFTTPYCAGGSLARLTVGRRVPPVAAARLVRAVADGVAGAHARGVVHRDLKPANVLLAPARAAAGDDPGPAPDPDRVAWDDWEPLVADFGLAKVAGGDAGRTAAGTVLGTPAYMAPEQARGEPAGPAADVYALGAVLFECLTGRPPFEGTDPLTVLRRVIEGPVPDVAALCPGVPRDLAAVVARATAAEPTRRYPSAAALAADLGCFLDGRPTAARPVTRRERLGMWARRNPAVAALTAAVALVLVAATAVSGALAYLAVNRAAHERLAREAAEVSAYRLTVRAADRDWLDGRADKAIEALDGRCPEHLRGWEWHYLRRRAAGHGRVVGWHGVVVLAVGIDPAGRRAASLGGDGLLRRWDVAAAAAVGEPVRVADRPVEEWSAALDPHGRVAAVFRPGPPRVELWDVDAGRLLDTVRDGVTANHRLLALAPGGGRLAACDAVTGGVLVWDVAGRKRLHLLTAKNDSDAGPAGAILTGCRSAAFSPDGGRLAVGTRDRATVWDATTGAELRVARAAVGTAAHELHAVESVAFAGPDVLVTGGRVDPRVKERAELVWHDLRAASFGKVLAADRWWYHPVTAGPDGVGHFDRQRTAVRVAADGREVGRVRCPATVNCAVRAPGGLLTGDQAGAVRLWNTDREPGGDVIRLPKPYRVFGLAVAADGTVLFTADAGRVCVWDPAARAPARFLAVGFDPNRTPGSLALSPDGERTIAVNVGPTVQLWDWRAGVRTAVLTGPTAEVRHVLFLPGGRVAALARDGGVHVWDADRPADPRVLFRFPGSAAALVASPDGRTLAVAGEATAGPHVLLLDADTGAVVGDLPAEPGGRAVLAFDAAGRRLAVGTTGFGLEVWDCPTRARLAAAARAHDEPVRFVLFVSDGRVASGADDGSVKVWDAADLGELLTLRGHAAAVNRAAVLSGGRLFTSSWDETVRVWDGSPEPRY